MIPAKIILPVSLWLVLALLPGAGARAEQWFRGAVAIAAVEGEPRVEIVGGERFSLQADDGLAYQSGVLRVRSEERSALALQLSNGLAALVEGPGFFAIERFEQVGPASALAPASPEADRETLRALPSRLILNLREGTLVLDNRGLPDASQLIVETPVGRLILRSALWTMTIEFDERSEIFTFSMECGSGLLRFTDRRGTTYALRAGQRLSGAGSSSAPAIEVGELSGAAEDIMTRFETIFESEPMAGADTIAIMGKMEMRPDIAPTTASAEGTATPAASERSVRERRPIPIEYAPRSEPVTPFRGLTKPPSTDESEDD